VITVIALRLNGNSHNLSFVSKNPHPILSYGVTPSTSALSDETKKGRRKKNMEINRISQLLYYSCCWSMQ
jgi:hypothetical protein